MTEKASRSVSDLESIISIRAVSKHFDDVCAVDNVELNIERGEFFSLLGSSGCGKSTLLRMLAGFETPTSGEIYIDGQDMSTAPAHQRPVNMVFQNYAIFPHLDVGSNIAFGLRKSGLSKTAIKERVEEMLELIRLPGYGERSSSQLSGGERQRVALARALIMRPKVLLLDEPLGALDRKLREQMQFELRTLQKSVGITFIFVTHDQEEALTMSDRIAVMSKGKVLQVATPVELYQRPNSRFVADFIGTMNFFDGRIEKSEGAETTINVGALGIIKTVTKDKAWASGSKVVVGIRPEKLRIEFEAASPSENIENIIEGRMGPVAYLGDRSHFHVFISGREQPISVAVQNVENTEAERAEADQPIWLSFSPDSVVLLENDNPERT